MGVVSEAVVLLLLSLSFLSPLVCLLCLSLFAVPLFSFDA
jgi:hypothetical protein